MDMSESRFERVDLRGARFQAVDLSNVEMRNVDLIDVEISGAVENLTINGVDVGPLIEAELDARHPLRVKMRPTDPDGFREAWDIIERLWGDTVARARSLPAVYLDKSVEGEWSFIQTLRHLIFATDSWVSRVILGDPTPWDPLGLPWNEMPDKSHVPHDLDARPTLDAVLELRRDRMATVRRVIDGLTRTSLDAPTPPVDAPGWPPPKSFTARKSLLIILNEEWEHRMYAERDLSVLETSLA